MTSPKTYAKAIYGAITAGIAAAVAAAPDGFTTTEALIIAGAVSAGFGAVYFATNQTKGA